MPLESKSGRTRYQLRYAAGIYWLLDMSQPGYPYRKPLPLNEMGARIWNMLEKGLDAEEITAGLAVEYGISQEEVGKDVREFCQQLKQQGIEAHKSDRSE